MTTATATATCNVCGQEHDGNPSEIKCGVLYWFRGRGVVRPIDMRVNFGLVLDLLRDGRYVVQQGKILQLADWPTREEFAAARDAQRAELEQAERAVFDAAADEIIDRLGPVAEESESEHYSVSAPASLAIGRRPLFRGTFAGAVNWTGGIWRMFDALNLLRQHTAVMLRDTARLSEQMVREINDREHRLGPFAVGAAHQMVDCVADTVWGYQCDGVQDIVDEMYSRLEEKVREIIGVEKYHD